MERFIILWLGSGFVVGFLGSTTTMGFWGSTILAILLSPVLAFIILLFFPNAAEKRKREQQQQEMLAIHRQHLAATQQVKKTGLPEQFAELAELHKTGTLTDTEYQLAKAKLLA